MFDLMIFASSCGSISLKFQLVPEDRCLFLAHPKTNRIYSLNRLSPWCFIYPFEYLVLASRLK